MYRRDLVREKTVLVARDANSAAISANGRHVAFISERAKGPRKAMVRDMKSKDSEPVSRQSKGQGGDPAKGNTDAVSISSNGRYLAFESPASNLSNKDSRGRDVFWRDVKKDQTRLVSLQSRSRGGKGANCCSEHPAISPDGRYIALDSSARSLSPYDTSSVDDVYLRSLKRRTTELVSRQSAADGGAVQDAGSANPRVLDLRPAVSAHGRVVAFQSTATNLSDPDGASNVAVFLRDISARTTALVSRQGDAAGGAAANGDALIRSHDLVRWALRLFLIRRREPERRSRSSHR